MWPEMLQEGYKWNKTKVNKNTEKGNLYSKQGDRKVNLQ